MCVYETFVKRGWYLRPFITATSGKVVSNQPYLTIIIAQSSLNTYQCTIDGHYLSDNEIAILVGLVFAEMKGVHTLLGRPELFSVGVPRAGCLKCMNVMIFLRSRGTGQAIALWNRCHTFW